MEHTEKLRKPTAQEMKQQVVPLLQQYKAGDQWRDTPYYPTFEELREFMRKHGIPSGARVSYENCGSHTVELVW